MESECSIHPWGKVWFNSKGEYHRENDLPAIENNGYKEWCINGECHRELGPASIYPNGTEHWYLNGIQYAPKEMPIKLFMIYCNWEYRKKKNGI